MTIGLAHSAIFLVDNWPGEVTQGPNPDDWSVYSATEDYPLGTKRMVYDDTNNGWATLMFLKYSTGAGTVAVATVRSICAIDTTAVATAGQYCHVTNDGSDAQLTGPLAVALGTLTNNYYGWFWVGGVCPVDTIATLDDGLYGTDGGITGVGWMVIADSASVCKFRLQTATDIGGMSAFGMTADTTA
jgi:hypothetical protein